jgi:hypothetical protein
MTTRIVSWSYSSLKQFEQCPRLYHETYVLKSIPYEETEQRKYGNQVHKAAENYVRHQTPIPEQFAFMQPIIDTLLKFPGRKFAEQKLALDSKLEPCDWKSRDAWYRGVSDLTIIDDDNFSAKVVDYKTGSAKYPDIDQIVLMELMTFAHNPHVKRVKGALLFVVKNVPVKHALDREDSDKQWWKFRERIAKLEAHVEKDSWNPKSGPLCGWCPVKSCEFNPKH